MGTGPADKLKEIESLRSGLDEKLGELEERFPPLGQLGKGLGAVVLGGGAGGGTLMLAYKALRKRRKGKKEKRRRQGSAEAVAAPQVVVHGLPKGTLAVVVAVAAAWAGIRFYEMKMRGGVVGEDGAAIVRPLPERQASR